MAAFDTSELSSPENQLAARALILRARIALGDAHDVLAELADDDSDDDAARPELEAIAAFAKYVAGDAAEAVEAVEKLAQASSDNAVVQVLGGTVLHGAAKSEDALALLSKHQGSLEAYGKATFFFSYCGVSSYVMPMEGGTRRSHINRFHRSKFLMFAPSRVDQEAYCSTPFAFSAA